MAKNISKLFGTPSTRAGGIKQHKELVHKLRNNDVFSFKSMNRGYLVLKHEVYRAYPSRPKPTVEVWSNYLQDAKPTGKFIKVTKV
jgi:hypothetical protein